MKIKITRIRPSFFLFNLLICLLLAVSGCSLGPKSLKGNRIDYNISIQKSNNEDLLVNIVRASYFEPLFFLQVGTISSSFSYGATVGASGTLYERTPPGTLNSMGASLGASFSEVPTITYAPLQGQQAIKQLLAEIPLDRFLLMTRSGWNIASLLWTITQQVGPLHNYSIHWKQDNPLLASYNRFLDLSETWADMQDRGEFELPGLDKDALGRTLLPVHLVYRSAQEADRVDRLLGVQTRKSPMPDGRVRVKINLADRCDPGVPDCVPIKLRSFFGVLYDISQVGGKDSQRSIPWAREIPDELKKRKGIHRGLITVRTSSFAPSEAYAAVNYRNAWHYIADDDFRSKAYFTLIGTIFSLQSAEVPLAQPFLTIPTAR